MPPRSRTRIEVRVTPELRALVDRLAIRLRVKPSEVVRIALIGLARELGELDAEGGAHE